ncbi:MAG: hypothetical protein ACI9E1_000358 [Cryomorphaceae bacterium]|jgi:hypothetical protein
MIEIFRHANLIKVSLYQRALEEQGIATLIRNETIAMTEIPIPVFYPNLCIMNDEDHEKSLEILKEIIKREQTESEAPDINCPQCNESNPANFETCWSCSGELSV